MGTAAAPALAALAAAATRDPDKEVRMTASRAIKTIQQVKMFQDSGARPAN